MENIDPYLGDVDREELRIYSFSSSANGSLTSSSASLKEVLVHRVTTGTGKKKSIGTTSANSSSSSSAAAHQTTLDEVEEDGTITDSSDKSGDHFVADSFANHAKERLLKNIENVERQRFAEMRSNNNSNDENRCPSNRIVTAMTRRSPIKQQQRHAANNHPFIKAKDDPALKNLMATLEQLTNEINQRDDLIDQLKQENSFLSRKKDHEMDASLALNIASTEQNYFLFEINRLKQIIKDEVAENEALRKKVELLEKSMDEMGKEQSYIDEQKRTVCSQVERLKRANKDLANSNHLLKIERDNLAKQIEILEDEKVLAAEISKRSEELLRENVSIQEENRNLIQQIEMLREEIKKNSDEFEKQIATLKKSSDEDMAKLRTRMSENENKSGQLIKDYELCLKQSQSEIEKLNKERSSFLKSLAGLQEEREKAREELNTCRDTYERRLNELTTEMDTYKKSLASMNEVHVEQQKRIDRLYDELDEKGSEAEKRVRSKQDEARRAKQAQQLSDERLKCAELRHAKEMDETRRKAQKDVDEWRFKCEQTAARNAELSRANGEMRRRLQTLEVEIKDLADKNIALKHSLDTAQRQKRELRDEFERNTFNMRKEIETLLQQRDENSRKTSGHQAAMTRLQQQLDERQKELVSLAERNRHLEQRCRIGESYKMKYNDIKTYLRRGLYESSQMAMSSSSNDLASSRAQFFTKMIRELRLDSTQDIDAQTS